MSVKMTNEQWEALLSEDKEVLKALGLLSLVKPKEKTSKAPQKKALPLLEPYVLKKIVTCNVCKTVCTIYFRMKAFPGKSFLTSTRIEQKDILPIDNIKESQDICTGCSQCYEILGNIPKEDLIKKIIKLSKW